MDTTSTKCNSTADTAFGPRVHVACRAFDFTVYFEDLFFACLPSALFFLLFLYSSWLLWKEPHRVRRSRLLVCKLVALAGAFVCQATFLLLRQLGLPLLRSRASLAGDLLELVAIISASALSYLHHCRSIQPSTPLILFLSARSLLAIARVRTLWLISPFAAAAIPFTVGFVITLISMVFESRGKESILNTPAAKPATPEPFSGFWKRVTFAWLAGTFRQGYVKILSVRDLPDLDPQLDSHVVGEGLREVWSYTDGKLTRHALLYACLRTYSVSLLSAVIPRLCLTGFTFCQPLLIDAAVAWVGSDNAAIDSGKGLIGAFALVYTGIAIFTALYGYKTFRFTIRLRGGLISLIHQQTLQARAVDLGQITPITVMGTDVERIVTGFRSIHDLWGCLVDIAIAIYLLERQIGVACVVPALIVIIFVCATFKLSAITSSSQRTWIEKVEDRLRFTSYVLENIKAVKMLGLSEKVSSVIRGLRHTEIAASAVFRKLLIGRIVLSNSPADLAPMATFGVYVIIALAQHNSSILAAQAFTSLSLISLVTTPVLTFIQAVPAVMQCVGCFDRIQEYCSASSPPYHCPTRDRNISSIALPETSKLSTEEAIIVFRRLSTGWNKGAPPILRDITLSIRHSAITMIVGPIGSGKSTLLESILGETAVLDGKADRTFSTCAYCSQIPWLRSQTMQQNIIGAMSMDPDWYATVTSACGLKEDFNRLPQGDQTPVGSNGLALSGGQKQRLALARALYSRCRVVLLDDIFSGTDPSAVEDIARSLFSEAGMFRKLRTTVVLATHSNYLLQYADDIVVLGNGRIVGAGSLASLRSCNPYFQSLDVTSTIFSDNNRKGMGSLPPMPVSEDANKEHSQVTELGSRESTVISTRQHGDLSVYAYYVSASGRTMITLSLAFIVLWVFCREFPTVWLNWWTEANAKSPNSGAGMYLGIYSFLGISGVLFMIIVCWLIFVNVVSRSALRLHDNLLITTFRAPFQFFIDADIGSITNRFSQDMDLVDMSLPIEALNFIVACVSCVVKLIILAVFAKYLAIAIPIVAVTVFLTQKVYLRTSRQMRLLDIEAKAPLYSHFLELVNGAATIRAFGWQDAFNITCISLLNISQRPVYLLCCIQQCLGFVLDMLVTAMAVILMSTVVFLRHKFDPGDVGVALIMVMTFNIALMQLIKFWTMMETSIGAVSRVKSYATNTKPEQSTPELPAQLPSEWPSAGAIQLSGVVAGPSKTAPAVLKGISMSVHAGEKIAICGPSGSGKTSLILTLLRIIELQQGSIIVDGVALSQYSRDEVRGRFNVVTQDPFLVAGTLRFNIDPWQNVSDGEIIGALRKLHLWEDIEQSGGLDMSMKATSWSLGQRQLLCLARAMVRKSKVLILDEATSSVDNETEQMMQDIVDTEFSSHTVLAVVHRLRFIRHFDKVAVMDGGFLVEFDTPEALLSRDSQFAAVHFAENQRDY